MDAIEIPAMSDYERAAERWAEVEGRRQALSNRETGQQLALMIARNPADTERMPAALLRIAEPWLDMAERNPDALIEAYRKTQDDIEAFAAALPAEAETWQAARRAETKRRAFELQPEHRAAVGDMAKALELLSDAIARERHARAQLRPLRESVLLPDCSSVLEIGTFDELNSRLARWRADMLRIGMEV